MKNKNITMKVLMETMKRLNQEANYKNFLPDPKKKNFSMSVDKLAALAAADERDSEEHLDNMYKDAEKEREPKKGYIPNKKGLDLQGDEDLTTVGGRGKVAEIDFGGADDETTTTAYNNDEDTIPDAASTTDMVDALSDQVVAQLEDEGVLPLDLSTGEAKEKVGSALLAVLQAMHDADNLYDR